MCSSDLCNLPAAPESKDLVAIIHPHPTHWQQTQRPLRIPIPLAGRLHLSNRFGDVTTSRFQFESHNRNHIHDAHTHTPDQDSASGASSRSSSPSPDGTATLSISIRIHEFGRPLALAATGELEIENPVVHYFAMATEMFVGVGQTQLGKRLDLGVGGEGVVGRTVSVVGVDGGVLGEGVIGIGRI